MGSDLQVEGKSVLVKFGIDAYANGKKVDPETIDWSSSAPQTLYLQPAAGQR